jgi:hypothetical protein
MAIVIPVPLYRRWINWLAPWSLCLAGVAMIQINEFGVALALFVLSTVAFAIQIFTSNLFPNNSIARNGLRLAALCFVITLNSFMGLVTYRIKGNKPWSNVIVTEVPQTAAEKQIALPKQAPEKSKDANTAPPSAVPKHP